ncbi:MAG: helix-turn-helix transcriptional regulator [Ruminiclostridium sp.]|nr:helix-turn-helix transcriptional regulator [Ruminiclostridium sp.]
MSDTEVYDFGLRLRQLREARKISRKAFAKKLGVSKETIYRYESNVQTPSLDRTKQMAIILQTSMDYLVGFSDDPGLTREQRKALEQFLLAFRE